MNDWNKIGVYTVALLLGCSFIYVLIVLNYNVCNCER
jgi:hypothetical protein